MALLQWPMTGTTTASRPVYDERQSIALFVPYFSQVDSPTGQAQRMCFSSTCAMPAAFLKPGCLAGGDPLDDRYLVLVERFGDTTNATAQVRTPRTSWASRRRSAPMAPFSS